NDVAFYICPAPTSSPSSPEYCYINTTYVEFPVLTGSFPTTVNNVTTHQNWTFSLCGSMNLANCGTSGYVFETNSSDPCVYAFSYQQFQQLPTGGVTGTFSSDSGAAFVATILCDAESPSNLTLDGSIVQLSEGSTTFAATFTSAAMPAALC